MAATLTLSKAKVVDEAGTVFDNVSVYIRSNRALVMKPGSARSTALRELPDVASVVRKAPMTKFIWTVTFSDGMTWEVERRGGCNCGHR